VSENDCTFTVRRAQYGAVLYDAARRLALRIGRARGSSAESVLWRAMYHSSCVESRMRACTPDEPRFEKGRRRPPIIFAGGMAKFGITSKILL